MKVELMIVSMFATNCYLVYCLETGEAVVIDPGAEGKKIIERIKALNLSLKYIVNTHGHVDHIGANRRLKEVFDAPILLSRKDLELYRNPGYGLGLVLRKQPEPEKFIGEGDQVTFGKAKLQVIETPGHTEGGICLHDDYSLFCGDTLFAGSIGRTDLQGGSYAKLISSITERLLVLPARTVVFPGHGPATTIETEKTGNLFLL